MAVVGALVVGAVLVPIYLVELVEALPRSVSIVRSLLTLPIPCQSQSGQRVQAARLSPPTTPMAMPVGMAGTPLLGLTFSAVAEVGAAAVKRQIRLLVRSVARHLPVLVASSVPPAALVQRATMVPVQEARRGRVQAVVEGA